MTGAPFGRASMAKAKREPKPKSSADEGYEFKMPEFDEAAFIRREVASAKASFWTLGIAALAGILAYLVYLPGIDWRLGWIPIFAALGGLRPILERLGFDEEITKPKALIGSYFMLFFTALGLWILGVNLIPL